MDVSASSFGDDIITAYIEQSVNMSGDIYAARLNMEGNFSWEDVEVTNSGTSKSDMMAGKGQGCLFIAWTENGNVYAHCLREDGTLGSPIGSLLGDINNDGITNILDVIIVINIILNNEYDINVDLNQDNIINIQDIILLVNIILN